MLWKDSIDFSGTIKRQDSEEGGDSYDQARARNQQLNEQRVEQIKSQYKLWFIDCFKFHYFYRL